MTVRSLLYVPASRPRMLAGLHRLRADAVLVDLEDGVAPDDKHEARRHVRDAAERGELATGPPWSLRVNAAGTPWHADDLELADAVGAPRVVLPKAERTDAVARLAERCAGRGARIGLMLETAAGVGRARELAAAHAAVDLLVYGSADYRLSTGARPDEGRGWEMHALGEILLAARMHDLTAVDCVYFRYRDLTGLARHARVARELGFDGKSCIHPDQVPVLHEVFSSSSDELAWASAVRRGWIEQDGERRGVVVVEGEMIEALHVRLAERILERAPERRAGEDGP